MSSLKSGNPCTIDWEIEQHHRLGELVIACERAGGRSLADVWDGLVDTEAARLVVGAVPDPESLREPLRRMAIAHMHGYYLPGAIARTYLDAARAASLGSGTWEAVEEAYATWEPVMKAQAVDNYDDGWHDHINWMIRLPRRTASFGELRSYISYVDLDTLRDALGNPFRARCAA